MRRECFHGKMSRRGVWLQEVSGWEDQKRDSVSLCSGWTVWKLTIINPHSDEEIKSQIRKVSPIIWTLPSSRTFSELWLFVPSVWLFISYLLFFFWIRIFQAFVFEPHDYDSSWEMSTFYLIISCLFPHLSSVGCLVFSGGTDSP